MGINIALGTDGPASNNGLDMFKEMYLLASFNRLQTQDEKFIPAFEFLKMATVNGARAMGLKDADVLDVNKLADIIMIDLSKPNMQPLNNIVTNLVYAGSKDNVIMTMINGKILYENGKYNINESIEDIYKAADAANERLEKAAKNEL
jgi:5-methylthioadenosine/S-adenosylhomocysteine deaminase